MCIFVSVEPLSEFTFPFLYIILFQIAIFEAP